MFESKIKKVTQRVVTSKVHVLAMQSTSRNKQNKK